MENPLPFSWFSTKFGVEISAKVDYKYKNSFNANFITRKDSNLKSVFYNLTLMTYFVVVLQHKSITSTTLFVKS